MKRGILRIQEHNCILHNKLYMSYLKEISLLHNFFTETKALWDQLSGINSIPVCTCIGYTCNLAQRIVKQHQEVCLVQLLMKLDTEYANVRSNILMVQPLPNVLMAYRLLIQEEKQRSIVTSGETHAMAFAAEDKKFDSKIVVYKPPNY